MWERCKARIKIAYRNFILTITPLFHGYLIALVAFCFVIIAKMTKTKIDNDEN